MQFTYWYNLLNLLKFMVNLFWIKIPPVYSRRLFTLLLDRVNVDAKIINKIIENWIQLNIKSVTCHSQVGFISGTQCWITQMKLWNIFLDYSTCKNIDPCSIYLEWKLKNNHLNWCIKSIWQKINSASWWKLPMQ